MVKITDENREIDCSAGLKGSRNMTKTTIKSKSYTFKILKKVEL